MADAAERSNTILKLLVEHYIKEGQPVSSKALACRKDVSLSPATVRNVMMALENEGLLHSPHTSAGRVPTPEGFRIFVRQLLVAQPINRKMIQSMQHQLALDLSPEQACRKASEMVAQITGLTGVVTFEAQNKNVIEKLEFIPLSPTRLLCILVLNNGEVQNRLVDLKLPMDEVLLKQANELLNEAVHRKSLDVALSALQVLASDTQKHLALVGQMSLEFASNNLAHSRRGISVCGEAQLLNPEISADLNTLRKLFDTVTNKSAIVDLMERCCAAKGVNLFIGEDNGMDELKDCSLISAPFALEGDVVGALAVIGPTRMDYSRVIPLVDVTAKLLGSSLNKEITSP